MVREYNHRGHRKNSEKEIRNLKARSSKQIQMTKTQNPKQYDLEDRTLTFARKGCIQ
jgi:hypothetical protein